MEGRWQLWGKNLCTMRRAQCLGISQVKRSESIVTVWSFEFDDLWHFFFQLNLLESGPINLSPIIWDLHFKLPNSCPYVFQSRISFVRTCFTVWAYVKHLWLECTVHKGERSLPCMIHFVLSQNAYYPLPFAHGSSQRKAEWFFSHCTT